MIVPIATSKLLPLNDPPTSDICHTPVRPHGAQPRAARGTGASAFSTDHATSKIKPLRLRKFEGAFAIYNVYSNVN